MQLIHGAIRRACQPSLQTAKFPSFSIVARYSSNLYPALPDPQSYAQIYGNLDRAKLLYSSSALRAMLA